MGGMPSTNAPGYAPQQSPAPAAGGKMPASQSQYGPPQQGQQAGRPMNPSALARQRALAAQAAGTPFTEEQHKANLQQAMTQSQQQSQMPQSAPQQAARPMSPSQIARQQALAAQAAGTPLTPEQSMANLQAAMTQSQQQQAAMGQGQNIPQDVLSRYNQVNQASQGPGGYGTQQQAQAQPFQTQQMLNNIQQGTGALGQMGQQGYPQPGAQVMGGTVTPQTYTGQQAQTGYQAPSSDMSQLYNQFNQAQGMGQGQQQQSYGSQSAGQPSGGFMSGTGGGTTGGGASRGKGFRSGGAVNNVRLSNDDVKRILNALATAREVVKNGK
jgi:hypothetical protein